MEFELPEPIRVEAKIGDRLILVRAVGDANEFVTIDFEWRRWQRGNHPLKILNFTSTNYKSRNWKMRMVADAVQELLSVDHEEVQEPVRATTNGDPVLGQQPYLFTEEPQADTEPFSGETNTTVVNPDPLPEERIPGAAVAYAWKRIVDGQISQDINAPTPEALFMLAGFRPYRVFDPIQGYRCVPVQWRNERWAEIKALA
jgi:hypothetical protein